MQCLVIPCNTMQYHAIPYGIDVVHLMFLIDLIDSCIPPWRLIIKLSQLDSSAVGSESERDLTDSPDFQTGSSLRNF